MIFLDFWDKMWLFFLVEQITDGSNGWCSESLELGLVLIKYRLRNKTEPIPIPLIIRFKLSISMRWGEQPDFSPYTRISPTQFYPPTRTCQKKHEIHTESEEIWKMWRLEIGIDCLKLQNLLQFTAKKFSNFPPIHLRLNMVFCLYASLFERTRTSQRFHIWAAAARTEHESFE